MAVLNKLMAAVAHLPQKSTREAGGLVAGPCEDGFVGKQRQGRAV